ncbi:MAG: hypothetical protein K8R92_04590 [Planctomycetes bacterium]|nr:hypothetical protein [Planctomycetota bacterium]
MINSTLWTHAIAVVFAACLTCGCHQPADTSAHSAAPETTTAEPAPAPQSSSAAFPTDELLATLRSHSVHRHHVDWPKVEPDIRARVARAATDDEKAAAIVGLFAQMNDVHSVLQIQGRSHLHYEGLDEDARQKLLPLLEREQAQSGKVAACLLDGRFGYVLVPTMAAYTPEQIEHFAHDLSRRITEIADQKPAGWIVDLRLNGGGNLYPMLLGLGSLLGEGVVGGTIDADGRAVQQWVLKSDGLYWRDSGEDRRFVAMDLSLRRPDATAPVVVLLGPMTRSSGQATALAFKGRPRTLLLGEPTAKGYTTVTNPISFGPDVTLSLAVGYMADRNGNACELLVLPEETVIGGDSFDDLKEDRKVREAIKWLELDLKNGK